MTLQEFFAFHPKAALGFSGGVDSSYLLYAAKAAGADVRPYFLKTPFQPRFELDDALRLARDLGTEVTVVEYDVLQNGTVAQNPENRCYYCKTALFRLLRQRSQADGYAILLDGTNASDDAGDRPGMRALREQGVLSPLRLCGLTKDEIRQRSREAGLFTWDKPAYACLATRIPTGMPITEDHPLPGGGRRGGLDGPGLFGSAGPGVPRGRPHPAAPGAIPRGSGSRGDPAPGRGPLF